MFMAAMAMVLPWKSWRYSEFREEKKKKKKFDPHFKNLYSILQENRFKELTLILFESLI